MAHTSNNSGSALAFLAGIGAGVAAGLLLAPRSGYDTRTKLRVKAMEARNKLADKANAEKDMLQDTADKINHTAKEVGDKVASKTSDK